MKVEKELIKKARIDFIPHHKKATKEKVWFASYMIESGGLSKSDELGPFKNMNEAAHYLQMAITIAIKNWQ